MQVASLPPSLISSSCPLSHKRSFVKVVSALEVVVDRRWSWSRVTEREELVGRISLVSLFPQYLMDVSGLIVVQMTANNPLNACNIDRRRRRSLVDCHCSLEVGD